MVGKGLKLQRYRRGTSREKSQRFGFSSQSVFWSEHPALKEMVRHWRKQVLVVITPKIDRLARNIVDLNLIVSELQEHGKNVAFIENNMDTSTANGRLFLDIIGSFAEFEAKVISERVKRWMREAKEKWVHVGRPRSKEGREEDEVKKIRIMRQRKRLSYAEIAKMLGYSSGSVIRNKLARFRGKKKK